MIITQNEKTIKSSARVKRVYSLVVAFICAIISTYELIDFNPPTANEATLNIPSLISLSTESSMLAYLGLITIFICFYFIRKSDKVLNKKSIVEYDIDDSERGKHIRASREEALVILESGDYQGAFSCMCTELSKNSETKEHEFIGLCLSQLIDGSLNSVEKMRCCLNQFK